MVISFEIFLTSPLRTFESISWYAGFHIAGWPFWIRPHSYPGAQSLAQQYFSFNIFSIAEVHIICIYIQLIYSNIHKIALFVHFTIFVAHFEFCLFSTNVVKLGYVIVRLDVNLNFAKKIYSAINFFRHFKTPDS